MPPIVDADAHVIEGAPFAKLALERWPDRFSFRVADDGTPGIVIEGRRYPEYEGPGAGCPPQHGVSQAPGIDPSSVAGMLADADRDHIDEMVLYPSMGLAVPSLEDPAFAAGFAGLYNEFIADWCKQSGGRLHGVAVLPTRVRRPRELPWAPPAGNGPSAPLAGTGSGRSRARCPGRR